LAYISHLIAPLLKRDVLAALPTELSLHILSFIDEPKTLTRVACVSQTWKALAYEDNLWKKLCLSYDFGGGYVPESRTEDPLEELEPYADLPMDPALEWLAARKRQLLQDSMAPSHLVFSFRKHFKKSYITSEFDLFFYRVIND
jgi:F-box and WD-40 domain protein CDC4